MPVLKIDNGQNSARVGHYLYFDREGRERAEAFSSNMSARTVGDGEREFGLVRDAYGKKDGPEFHQAYISFQRSDLGALSKPDGSPDWDRLVAYGREWARQAGIADRHQLYVVAHGDRPHPHIHIVWNATSHEDGRKYHFYGRKELDRFRDINDHLARENGIQRIPDRNRDAARAPDGVIRAVERGGDRYSWRMDLQARIRAAASEALGERQFREELRKRGVDLKVRGGEYSYRFVDDLEKKRQVRAAKLGEEYRRAPIRERLDHHNQVVRQPGGFAAWAQKAREEKDAFDSWRRDVRSSINNAKRRAHDWPSFERALERKGIRIERDGAEKGGAVRYIARTSAGDVTALTPKQLGRTYDPETLDRVFRENSFRREAASEIGKAARKAKDFEEFRARLSGSGITVDRVGDRFRYQVPAPREGGSRFVEGEALGPAFRTERIENRFEENRDRGDLYRLAMRTRAGSAGRADYLDQLKAQGVSYTRDDQGKGHLHFRGRDFEVGSLGPANPDRGDFDPKSVASLGRKVGREVGGLARDVTDQVGRASHEGYHDRGGPAPGRDRERRRPRGMDSSSTGAEEF